MPIQFEERFFNYAWRNSTYDLELKMPHAEAVRTPGVEPLADHTFATELMNTVKAKTLRYSKLRV